jgi:putative membrane protein
VLERDALLHYAHFLCTFLLAALLAGELFLFRKALPAAMVRQLQIVDRFYGIVAGLVLVTGLSLLFFGLKGAAFYLHNPVFWTKMVLFATVALLSIIPTVAFLKWNSSEAADGSLLLEDAQFRRIRGVLWTEAGLFAFIPLCAALMANGL